MKKGKRKKTTTGASPHLWLAAALFPLLALLALLPAAASAQRQKKAPEPHAVVAGTVFRDPGFALAGAEVALTAATPPAGRGKRQKPMKTKTSQRGEFFFHVPAAEASYTLRASARGHEPQEKGIRVYGEERVDVYFNLKPLPQ